MGRRTRRRIRRAATVVAVLLLLPIVLIAALLVLRPAREFVLGKTVDHLRENMPGELTVDRADWTSPGALELRGILWTSEGDTLLHLTSVRAEIDLAALRKRDLAVRSAEVAGTLVDVPGLTALFPTGGDDVDDDSADPFIRSGALPPAPSVSVDRFAVAISRIIASPGSIVSGLDLDVGLELRRDHDPELRLRCAAADAGGLWAVDELDLAWAPSRDEFIGSGRGRAAPDVPLTLALSGDGPHRFELILTGADVPAGGRVPHLTVDGALPDDTDPQVLILDGRFLTPGVAELAALPALAEQLASAPDLGGLEGEFRSRIVWGAERPEGDLDVDFRADDWCDRGDLTVRFDAVGARLDTLSLEAPGLSLAASGEATDQLVDLRAGLALRGDDLIRVLAPEAAPLDSLAVDLDLVVTGPTHAPSLNADLVAGLRSGETRIDRISAAARLTDGGAAGTAEWSVQAYDMSAAGALELERRDQELIVRTSPLLVTMGDDARALPVAKGGGLITRSADGSELAIEGVRLTGAVGELVLDADIGRTAGAVHAVATWPEPPAALDAVLDRQQSAALHEDWIGPEPWTIDLKAALSGLDAAEPEVEASATFLLPGPARLAFTLPPTLRVDDLGPLRGAVSAALRGERRQIGVDLSSTGWIDVGRAEFEATADGAVLESLDLAALGLVVSASGALYGDAVEAAAHLALADAAVLQRIEGAPADLDAALDLRIEASGMRTAPQVTARATASASGPEIDVPEVVGTATYGGGDLDVSVTAPDGMSFGATRLDTFVAALFGPVPGTGEQRISLRAAGPRGALEFGASLALDQAADPVWTLVGDTLNVRAEGRSLSLVRSFRLEAEPGSGRADLEGLAMAGDLGALDAAVARDRAGAVTGELNADLDLRAFDVRLGSRDDVSAVVLARFGGTGDEARFTLRAAVVDDADTLAVAVADMPGDAPERLGAGEAVPLSARLDLRGLPLPPAPGSDIEDEREVLVTGTAAIRGTTAAPEASAEATLVAIGRPELSDHRFDLTAGLDAGGLSVEAVLVRGSERLLDATVSVPGATSLSPAGFTPDPERPMKADIVADGLQFEDYASLMPPTVSVHGRIDMNLAAEGDPADPDLDGEMTLADVRVSLPDGSWLTLRGSAAATGTGMAPTLTGACEITGGVLRLPDPPQLLHPARGEPLLWRVGGVKPKAEATDGPRPDGPTTPDAAPSGPAPSVDVKLDIPSGMWLRGQGLEIALAGGLELRSDGVTHDILGDLAATRGYYRFLGRTFTVEKGEVSFDGGGELDPVLDMSLITNIDGIIYRVAFGGPLSAPRVTLTSNPEMPEGDIMAMLLFGRPLDELSSDQEGLVQDRAVDLVTAYGTAQLEANLSRQLKVDMVTLRRGGDADQGDALVIGKYLNQKVLLKYEQALDGWSSFMVNMEYFISNHLKLETSVSRHSQSAAGLNWSLDY